MFPWVVIMKQGCIIVTKAVAFGVFYRPSALMRYLPLLKCTHVGTETLPYGLSQTVLQTLLGADVITALS